jgi:hypothetical protein
VDRPLRATTLNSIYAVSEVLSAVGDPGPYRMQPGPAIYDAAPMTASKCRCRKPWIELTGDELHCIRCGRSQGEAP